MTKNHHPFEYFIVSHNEDAYGAPEGKIIYVGTKKQCEQRVEEIARFSFEYSRKVEIIKC